VTTQNEVLDLEVDRAEHGVDINQNSVLDRAEGSHECRSCPRRMKAFSSWPSRRKWCSRYIIITHSSWPRRTKPWSSWPNIMESCSSWSRRSSFCISWPRRSAECRPLRKYDALLLLLQFVVLNTYVFSCQKITITGSARQIYGSILLQMVLNKPTQLISQSWYNIS
jgi:hypothetical protein